MIAMTETSCTNIKDVDNSLIDYISVSFIVMVIMMMSIMIFLNDISLYTDNDDDNYDIY